METTTEEIPTYTGSSDDTLEDRLKTLEKANRGLIADLQSERERRHQLEERQAQVENSLTSAAQDGEELGPEEKVNRLAQDPDGYIDTRIVPQIDELRKELIDLKVERKVERAKKWIAKQEKIDVDEVEEKYGQDLIRIGQTRGLTKLDPEEGIKASYEILKQERIDKERRESERSTAISGQTTETVRNPVRTGGMRFTREQISSMSPEEFNSNYAAIKDAQAKGLIK